jgi:hypothetical protein
VPIQPTVEYLAKRVGVGGIKIDDYTGIEQEIRDELADAPAIEATLDVFFLHAVEAGAIRNALLDDPGDTPRVDTAGYVTALEVFSCVPIFECALRLQTRATVSDVMPLRGDILKAFGDDAQPSVAELGTPDTAARVYRTIEAKYLEAAHIGRYQAVVESGSLGLRCGLWMLKAATIEAASNGGQSLESDDAMGRVDSFVKAFRARYA